MADQKISELEELSVGPALGDFIPIVDTDAAETKKITVANFSGAKDLLPTADVTYDIGSEALRWKDIFSKRIVSGGGALADNVVLSNPAGESSASVFGYVYQNGVGTAEIQVNNQSFTPLLVAGYVYNAHASGSAIINANATGASISGMSFNLGAGNALIENSGWASFVSGGALAGNGNDASIINRGTSASIFAYSYGFNSNTLIETGSAAVGAFVSGYANGAGGLATMSAKGNAQFVQGYVYSDAGTAEMSHTTVAPGAFAQGAVYNYGAALSDLFIGSISPNAGGSFAQGWASTYAGGDAQIRTSQKGSFAQGHAYTSNNAAAVATIESTARGAFAQGSAYAKGAFTAYIKAIGIGSFAHGHAYNGGISANNSGSTAFGYSYSNGSGTVLIEADERGSFVTGSAVNAFGAGDASIKGQGFGGFVSGFITCNYGGVAVVETSSTGDGSMVNGGIYKSYAGTAAIRASGRGSFVSGYIGAYAPGSTDETILASGRGSFAHGLAVDGESIIASANNSAQFGPGVNATVGSLQVGSNARLIAAGGIVQGYTGLFGAKSGAGTNTHALTGPYNNLLAASLTTGAGGTSIATLDGYGSSLIGNTYTYAGGTGYITSKGGGGLTGGMTLGNDGLIYGNGNGAITFGYSRSVSSGSSILRGQKNGSWTMGISASAGAGNSLVDNEGFGSIIGGYCYAGGAGAASITTKLLANGSFAFGYVGGGAAGASIYIDGNGSFATGLAASGESIQVTADNAQQFGPGTNALANTFRVGNAGISFKGTSGAPASPVNGEFWRNGDYTYVQSNDISVPLSDPGLSEVISIDAIRTFGLTDKGKTIVLTGSTPRTWTIDSNASVPFPIGTLIGGESLSSAVLTVAITSDTLRSSEDNSTGTRAFAAGGGFVIEKVATTEWKISGNQMT